MTPLLAVIRVHQAGRGFTLWAPVIVLWLLLALVALILSPLLLVYGLARGRNPIAVAAGVCGLVSSLGGTRVDVETPAASVTVRLV